MSQSYPLPRSDFWDLLKIQSLAFDLGEAMSISETGAGEILPARTGCRLWQGRGQFMPAAPGDQDQILALVSDVRQHGASFMMGDPRRDFPQADPGGALLGGNDITVQAIGADPRDLMLAGAPDGYALTRGDHFSMSYGAGPVRHYYGRVQSAQAVFDNGAATVSVDPPLPVAAQVGDAVRLVRPECKVIYLPQSFSEVERGPGQDSGFSMAWRQTKR